MGKFWTLVIYANSYVARMWINESEVYQLLSNKDIVSVFRQSTDQCALIVSNQVVWQDVPCVDFKQS